MKNVLFLVRKDKISIRRYILVARQLKKLNIGASFLNLTDRRFIIQETIEELGLSDFPESRVYNREPIDMLNLVIARIKKHILRKFSGNSMDKALVDAQQEIPIRDNFEDLLRQLNFNTGAIVQQYYNANIDWWNSQVRLSRDKIRKWKPDCIVYDLETPPVIRALLFAATKEKVKIVSMQHGTGFAEQYSNFPRLADYYIAYSPYCAEIIKRLLVKDENIFLTGLPDTDLIYNCDAVKIRSELESRYGVNFDRKIILAALRPAKAGSLDDANNALINTIANMLGNDEKFDILIKPHHKDYIAGIPFFNNKINYKNIKIIDSSYSFSRLLKISHYLITHISSCVVEAALMGIPNITIEFEDDGIWPPWNDYKILNKIHSSQMKEVLADIKNNVYSFRYDEKAREKFIERFIYKYDNKSAERIAKAIECII